ncbi:hypothetical protein [Nocardia vinacea]|uniref:hypothetical protein n=1 Tax=Nocardia vinacea TaxID=96468 RepID=UPI003AF267D3
MVREHGLFVQVGRHCRDGGDLARCQSGFQELCQAQGPADSRSEARAGRAGRGTRGCGFDTRRGGGGAFGSGGSAFGSGSSTLGSGSSTLRSGSSTLRSGSSTLRSGSSTLRSGSSTLRSGSSTLRSGGGTPGSGGGTRCCGHRRGRHTWQAGGNVRLAEFGGNAGQQPLIGIYSDGEAIIQTDRAADDEPRDGLAGRHPTALHAQRVVAGQLRGMRECHEVVRSPVAGRVHSDVVHRCRQMNPGT